MSASQPVDYKVDYSADVMQQIHLYADIAKASGKLKEFAAILKNALHQRQINPTSWGDPSHHVSGSGIVYNGTIRPFAFRYAVFEEIRTVILLRVRSFADFD